MSLCLFEDARVAHLTPLTLTRAAFDLRVGARTILEAAVSAFPPSSLAFRTRPSVARVTAQEHPDALTDAPVGGTLFLNARWLVRENEVTRAIQSAGHTGEARAFVQGDTLLALWHPDARQLNGREVGLELTEGIPQEPVSGETVVTHLWDLLTDLSERIATDAHQLGGLGTIAGHVQDGAILVERDQIHLAEGATVRAGAVVNADEGPVWIGPGATVEENAVVRGPVVLGPKVTVKAAARVDNSAIGYWSKVGGEVHESIVHSLSSKGHDGYLGNSYLGRWCNLGADTNTSNLKNDYGEVTMHDAVAGTAIPTGRQFLGLVMGDHSKCSINTMFNTGTVVGVSCNLYGSGFPPRHVPSFAWGGSDGLVPYRAEKALRVAEAVMARRTRELTEADRALLEDIARDHGLVGG
ncbi:MAG: putative sugar nucleotidyl transferase [Bacteroidota bacterium]